MKTYVVAVRKGIRDIYIVLKSGELYGNVRTCTTHKRSEIDILSQLGSHTFGQYCVTEDDLKVLEEFGTRRGYYRVDHIVFYGDIPLGATAIPFETGCKNVVPF